MSNKETGGFAYPVPFSTKDGEVVFADVYGNGGMTLRDYFAAKAMQSMCAEVARHDDFDHVAKAAYKMADSMLEARK